MKTWLALIGILLIGVLITGCEDSDEVPEYGEVRVENAWSATVRVLFDGEEKAVVAANKSENLRVGGELIRVSIEDDDGQVIFTQTVEIPENTFAKYIIQADGTVLATAGNIRTPDYVGGTDEQIALQNLANYPVELYAADVLMVTVPTLQTVTVNVPDTSFLVRIQRDNDNVLFEQLLEVPNNTVIHYAVMPDGEVRATGGPIEDNIDVLREQYPTYYQYYVD